MRIMASITLWLQLNFKRVNLSQKGLDQLMAQPLERSELSYKTQILKAEKE